MNKLELTEFMKNSEGNTTAVILLLRVMKTVIPEFEVKFKDEIKCWKLLPKMNRRAHTTLRNTVYYANRAYAKKNQQRFFDTLAHEFVHLVQRRTTGPFLHTLGYISPQDGILIPSIISVIAFIIGDHCIGWSMLALAVALLAPWPSKSRAAIEQEGYTMNIALRQWRTGKVSNNMRTLVVKCLRSPLYYFMVWREDTAEEMVDKMIASVARDPNSQKRPECFNISRVFKIVHMIVSNEAIPEDVNG